MSLPGQIRTPARPRLVLVLLFSLGLPACLGSFGARINGTSGKPDIDQLKLSHLSDCAQWRRQLIDSWIAAQLNAETVPVALESTVADSTSPNDADTPARTSDTNVQETGVDEADRIETSPDGDLYTISGTHVVRLDAFPPEAMQVVASQALGWSPTGIYYDYDRDLVFAVGQRWRAATSDSDGETSVAEGAIEPGLIAPSGAPEVVLATLDGSTLALRRELVVEGHYIDSRLVDGRLLLVTGYRPELDGLYDHPAIMELTERLREAADHDANSAETRRLRERLRSELDNILPPADTPRLRPTTWQNGQVRQRLSCDAIAAPRGVDVSPSLVMISSFDPDSDTIEQTGVLNEAWMVYATASSLYLVQTSGGWWWFGNSRPQQTAIWRFSIDGDMPRYDGVGVVDGWVASRFQLSERDGYLRLFTTGRTDDAPETSNLYVLSTAMSTLEPAAAITGIAPDERIFAARFIDDRAFLVTFRQVDPLFAFDLADPLNPRLVGELTIPGFSTYMHPVGQDMLLTIGRDGDEQGAIGNVAIQLFDVSDLAAPRAVTRLVPSGTQGWDWSPASYDPHAFLYDEPTGTLAVPWSTYDPESDSAFAGILVVDTDLERGQLTERGRIDHAQFARDLLCPTMECDLWQWWWAAFPQRTALMADDTRSWLYTVSEAAVVAVPVDAPGDPVGHVLLPAAYGHCRCNEFLTIGRPCAC